MNEELNQEQNVQENVEEPKTVEEPENKPQEKDVKTFTQEEIDKIIAERIARERKKYADYEELKAKALEYEQKLEEQRLAELSEKERAEEIAKKYEEERNQYAKQLEELQSTIREEKIRNAFITKAQAAGVAYIDDAYKLADLSKVEVGEDGTINGIDDVVKALVESKPFLVGQQKPKPVGESTNRQFDKSEKTADQLLQEAYEKAKKSGRPEDRIAYNKLKIELGK